MPAESEEEKNIFLKKLCEVFYFGYEKERLTKHYMCRNSEDSYNKEINELLNKINVPLVRKERQIIVI